MVQQKYPSSCFKWFFNFILIPIIGLTLIACAEEEIPQTETSGRITVYTPLRRDWAEQYLADFNRNYPNIEVELVREQALPLTQRLFDEQDDPQADVVWALSVMNMLQAEWKGMLKIYQPEGLYFDAQQREPRIATMFRDTNNPPYWVGVAARTIVICTNPDLMISEGLSPDELTSWRDLAEKEYRGKLVMPVPPSTSVGLLLSSVMIQRYGEVEGWDYLARIHENTGAYLPTATGACEAVARGEYPIAVSWGYVSLPLEAEGKVKTIFPEEGAGWELEVNALVQKKEIKPAAKTFLNWAIEDEAMMLHAANRPLTAANIDIPASEIYPENPTDLLLDQDVPWMAANRHRIEEIWCNKYGPSFGRFTPQACQVVE